MLLTLSIFQVGGWFIQLTKQYIRKNSTVYTRDIQTFISIFMINYHDNTQPTYRCHKILILNSIVSQSVSPGVKISYSKERRLLIVNRRLFLVPMVFRIDTILRRQFLLNAYRFHFLFLFCFQNYLAWVGSSYHFGSVKVSLYLNGTVRKFVPFPRSSINNSIVVILFPVSHSPNVLI